MYKHTLYFATLEECFSAKKWIEEKYKFEMYEDDYVDDEVLCYCWYTDNLLLVRQKEIINTKLKPTSFLSEGL